MKRTNSRDVLVLLLVLAGLFAVPELSLAQSGSGTAGIAAYDISGDPDPSFSADGKATISDTGQTPSGYFGEGGLRVLAKVDDRGRTVVASMVSGGGISLTRYLLGGTVELQTVKTLACTKSTDFVQGMAINGNSIILTGSLCNQWAVVRFNDDFSTDWSFGTDGARFLPSDYLKVPVAGTLRESIGGIPSDVVVDALFRIVVVGRSYHSVLDGITNSGYLDEAIAVVVYSWDGEILAHQVTNIHEPKYQENNFESAEAVRMQGSKIVIAGYVQSEGKNSGRSDIMLMRLRMDTVFPTGAIILSGDTSFSIAPKPGVQIRDLGNLYEAKACALDIDSLGRIVAAGTAFVGSGFHRHEYFAILRLTSNGARDTLFNKNGVDGAGQILMRFGSATRNTARAVVIDSYDRIVAGGYTNLMEPDMKNFALIRLTAAGTPDHSFGNGTSEATWGRVVTNFMCRTGEEIRSLAFFGLHGYRIIAAGNTGGGQMYCIAGTN